MVGALFRRGIWVSLDGGLGNQLFQYYAGLYVASRSSQRLYLDLTKVQFGRISHQLAIDSFELEGTVFHSKHRYSFAYFRQILQNLFKAHVKSFKIEYLKFDKVKRTYKSPYGGFDPNLERIERPLRLEGFFQTWRYYSATRSNSEGTSVALRLVEPSIHYQEMLTRIRAKRTLVLHVRRGDYEESKNSFGLLSVDYYIESLSTLEQKGFSWDQIWLFTDDVAKVKTEFDNLIEVAKIEVIPLEELADPAEVMMLMSHARLCVIANSTFSWWAATLGDKKEAVVCPLKWFKNIEDPPDLLPTNWIKISSSWVSDI